MDLLLQKIHTTQQNYSILDKELLAIKIAFEGWHHYLEGAWYCIQVYTKVCA